MRRISVILFVRFIKTLLRQQFQIRIRSKQNLIAQLTGPVKWTQSVQAMIADGANQFIEVGPGNVLQGIG